MRNQTVSILKGLAIFCVICAHCNDVFLGVDSIVTYQSLLLKNFGSIGVICFFTISGFLFKCENKRKFFVSKLKIFLPWIIGSIFVYLYVALRKPPISILGYINFFIGNGSYFYYLTVLMIIYLLYAVIPFLRKTVPCIVIGVVTLTSICFYDKINIAPTPYLNFLNWIGYFAFGILIKRHNDKFYNLFIAIFRFRVLIYLLYLGVLTIRIIGNLGGGYFGIMNFPCAILGAVTLLILAEELKCSKLSFIKKIFQDAGDFSLFIYIWHMPIAGIIAKVFSFSGLSYFVIVRPFIVFAIVLGAYYLVELLFKKPTFNKFKLLVGVRSKKI